jgi:hypothetical protein
VGRWIGRRKGIKMNKRERENRDMMYRTLQSLGLSWDDCETLRRCSMTLHRWAEHECNGAIQRDEVTGKPYVHSTYDGRKLYPVADREAGAIRRASKLLADHGLKLYHQGDPRGAALYVIRPCDVKPGEDVDSVYNRGVAVY